MARQISLSYNQAAKICMQAFDKARSDIEENMQIPNCRLINMSDASGEFIKVNEIYLGDLFGALDIIFSLDNKIYIYTVEQTADGIYCSAFDPDYEHIATEIKRRRRR
jgi:hypothetical protein